MTRSPWTKSAVLGVMALAIAVSARLSFPVPGSAVPQTAQTLVVALSGILLGPALGAGAVVIYLLLGALGVPVFAGGAAGIAHMMGPTAGYLMGFVPGAWVAGAISGRDRAGHPGRLLAAFLLAHCLILGLGWFRLTWLLGGREAWRQGVVPFLLVGILKSVAGVAVVAPLAGLLAEGKASPGS